MTFNPWEWWAKELADALNGVLNAPNPPISGMDSPWTTHKNHMEWEADRIERWEFATRALADFNEKAPMLTPPEEETP